MIRTVDKNEDGKISYSEFRVTTLFINIMSSFDNNIYKYHIIFLILIYPSPVMSEFGEFNLPRVARGHKPCCVLNVLASFEMASFHPLPRRFISIISWQLDTQPLPRQNVSRWCWGRCLCSSPTRWSWSRESRWPPSRPHPLPHRDRWSPNFDGKEIL